jgi:hypothetical protein
VRPPLRLLARLRERHVVRFDLHDHGHATTIVASGDAPPDVWRALDALDELAAPSVPTTAPHLWLRYEATRGRRAGGARPRVDVRSARLAAAGSARPDATHSNRIRPAILTTESPL